MKKLSLEYPVVVEGKYDKIKLDAIVATPIITLDGFSFFNDKKKQQLFRKYAENGIIILTDSDRAGAFIRSKLSVNIFFIFSVRSSISFSSSVFDVFTSLS